MYTYILNIIPISQTLQPKIPINANLGCNVAGEIEKRNIENKGRIENFLLLFSLRSFSVRSPFIFR